MSKRALAIRALGIATALVLVGASTASADTEGADISGGPPTPGGAVFLATDMNGTNAPPADPDGTGRVIVRIQGAQVCYLIQWRNVLAPFTGHIHQAPVGQNGPVVVGFWSGQLPANLTGVTGCVMSTAETVAAILADPAAYYANVHDTTYPTGSIKGQLRMINHGVDFNRVLRQPLVGLMDGMQEVPAAGDPDGRGIAFVGVRGTTVRFALVWSAIAAPTAAHIHVGHAAQAGPVVVPFFAAPTGLPPALNGVAGEVTVDAALARNIRRNPSGYYANLHNTEFPAGAIRGQLTRFG